MNAFVDQLTTALAPRGFEYLGVLVGTDAPHLQPGGCTHAWSRCGAAAEQMPNIILLIQEDAMGGDVGRVIDTALFKAGIRQQQDATAEAFLNLLPRVQMRAALPMKFISN